MDCFIEFGEGTLINLDHIVMMTGLHDNGEVRIVLSTGMIVEASGGAAEAARAFYGAWDEGEEDELDREIRKVMRDMVSKTDKLQ